VVEWPLLVLACCLRGLVDSEVLEEVNSALAGYGEVESPSWSKSTARIWVPTPAEPLTERGMRVKVAVCWPLVPVVDVMR